MDLERSSLTYFKTFSIITLVTRKTTRSVNTANIWNDNRIQGIMNMMQDQNHSNMKPNVTENWMKVTE